MLTRYFPESVDKLQRELSPVEGKKPVRANTQTTYYVESLMKTHALHTYTHIQIKHTARAQIIYMHIQVMQMQKFLFTKPQSAGAELTDSAYLHVFGQGLSSSYIEFGAEQVT
jgi:hypothetical protein